MNYEEFFKEALETNLSLDFDNLGVSTSHKLSNEALFHLPLIAMTILMLSKSRRKPYCAQIGQLVGECYERTFSGFKGSSQHLGWSANLRMRTVKALSFLEVSGLVEVDKRNARIIATDKGKNVIEKTLSSDSDLSYTLKVLERKYRDIEVEKQMSMELS